MSKLPKLHTQPETDLIRYSKMSSYLLKHPFYDLAVANLLGLTSTLMHIKQDYGIVSFNKDISLYFSQGQSE